MNYHTTPSAKSNVNPKKMGPLVADDIFGAVIRGDSTPAAVIEETDGELQAIIDATYNKKKND